MIRVLHVTGKMDMGGIETFIMNVYRRIDKRKIQFDFLLSSNEKFYYSDEIASLGGKIYHVPSRNGGKSILQNARALNDFFKKHPEYTIIHQHVSSLSYITPVLFAKKNKVPTRILHSHSTRDFGNNLNTLLHYIHKPLITKLATNFFAASNPSAEWAFPSSVVKNKKYKLINNAINLDNYNYNTNVRAKARKELSLKESDIVIGHVGRFVNSKNHEFILKIFSEIIGKNSRYKLLLIGDGPLEDKIKKQIQILNLQEKIILTGVRSDIPNLLNAMDIFLFPSMYEGLGMALIEAQATGLKCIASLNAVPEEVNITGLVDFISLEKSAEEWADKVIENTNYPRRDHSNKVKKTGYSIDQTVNRLEEFYLNS